MARKVLLADDSVTAQNMGRKILSDAGYEVVTVNNGSAALKKILELKPDLIVLDVYMPGYSGLEVCQRTKENKDTARIPILLTVGKLEPFKPEEARRAKADAFVVKPFEASELLAALTRLEDKIVPQPEPYKQGRFAKAVAAVDPDADDKDESWKARLRIPTGPPKSRDPEPETEQAMATGKGFRNLSVDTGKPQGTAREAAFERPMPAGLPADVTPDEIAAIAAAAAQLKGGATPSSVLESAEPAPSAEPEIAVSPETPSAQPSPVTFATAPEASGSTAEPGLSQAQAGATSTAEPEGAAVEAQNTAAISADAATVVHASQEALAASSEPATPEAIAAVDTPQPEVIQPEPTASSEIAASPTVAEVPVVAPEPVAAQAPPTAPLPSPAEPPLDDDVMAALQSLMPVGGSSAVHSSTVSRGTTAGHETPGALAAIVAEVNPATLKARTAGPRWIAEEVALAPDEATLSLEREMERAYAAVAASGDLRAAVAAPILESRPSPTIAVAKPLASKPAPPIPPVIAEPQVAEPRAVYAMAAGVGDAVGVLTGTAASSQEGVTSHTETAPTHREPEPAAIETHAPVSQAAPVVADEIRSADAADSPALLTEIAEGAEEMAANWKNIRDSIATGGAAKAAPAKEEEVARPAEPEKSEAEASAPAAADGSAPVSASDPRAIASIVDSVLAELRPRIVEEIARKLADPKKS